MKSSHETRLNLATVKSSVRTADLNRARDRSPRFSLTIYRPRQLDVDSRPRNGASVSDLTEKTRETPAIVGNAYVRTWTYMKSLSLQLADHKCGGTHRPRAQETCNTVSCPMWETDKWSEVRECMQFCANKAGRGARPETPERVVSNASLVSFRLAGMGLKTLSLRGHNRGI